jgi:hypothetical protein
MAPLKRRLASQDLSSSEESDSSSLDSVSRPVLSVCFGLDSHGSITEEKTAILEKPLF